jgi:hypothetical protein
VSIVIDFETWKCQFYTYGPIGLKVEDKYLQHLFHQGYSPLQGVDKLLDVMELQGRCVKGIKG